MYARPNRKLLALPIIAALVFAAVAPPRRAAAGSNPTSPDAATAQAQSALDAGRALLRRNRADEALPQLESALALFTKAGDRTGAAAAHDAIGDIYLRQGQYETAVSHFEEAYGALCGAHSQAGANLLLVKIGEARQLSGDPEAARAAFTRMNQCGTGDSKGASSGANDRSRGGAAFIPAGAALSLASCAAFSPSNQNNSANNSANNTANGQPNEPTLGHGPTPRNPSVRMDLRVVDENGNPVQNVKAKLESERGSGGLKCDCTHFTDEAGKVLMDPIHLTRTLKLKLEAKGYEPATLSVDPSGLNQPYRAVLRSLGAAKNAAGAASSTANSAQTAQTTASAAACFDLYGLFVGYVLGEFGQGRADYESGRLDGARAHYENAYAVANERSPAGGLQVARLFRAVARTNLGDIALREGRFDAAVSLYRQAVEGAQKDNRLELVWAAQRGLGHALWSQARQTQDAAAAARAREEALKAYRAAMATVETLFEGSLRADEARADFLATTRDLFDEAVGALAESALSNSPPSAVAGQEFAHAQIEARPLEGQALAYAAEAFRATEQGRARSLLDLIGESHAEITEGVPAELLARRADNRARQQEIADALRGVRAPAAAAPKETVAEFEAELERLNNEYNSIENQIRVASPRYSTLVRQQPLALADVQQQVLDEGTALLEYNLGRERSYLFAVTKSGLALYRLPARSVIEGQVVELRKQLVPQGTRRAIAGIDTAGAQRGLTEEMKDATAARGLVLGGPTVSPQVVEAFADASGALYNAAVAPAAQFVGARRLLVAADGTLNFVPFEALVTSAGGTDYASLNYLVKTNEVVYAPSATVVAALRQARAAAGTGGVLVVADPVFDPTDKRASGRQVQTKEAAAQRAAMQSAISDVTRLKAPAFRLVRLAGTRTEAEQIATLARTDGGAADVWLDFDASEANLRRRDLTRYRILHVATHGLLDAERPQFTGLALSLVGDSEADGFLRVDEVFNLRLGSPLVMLSACETGLGKEQRGEGVMGLTRAFMYAGAPTVGVSLWSVADRSTAELMPDFYKRLLDAKGDAPPAALRAAQQQMIAGGHYSAPFYWAPFVLVGDWK